MLSQTNKQTNETEREKAIAYIVRMGIVVGRGEHRWVRVVHVVVRIQECSFKWFVCLRHRFWTGCGMGLLLLLRKDDVVVLEQSKKVMSLVEILMRKSA